MPEDSETEPDVSKLRKGGANSEKEQIPGLQPQKVIPALGQSHLLS